MSSAYLSPPPTPPHTATPKRMSNVASSSVPNFRLPSQPTIVLKAPSEETIARFRQLAPYYWQHPETTNCSVHFPIDLRTQQRIQSYQARQRQHVQAQHRARGGSTAGIDPSAARRPSLTPPNVAPAPGTPGRSPSISRQGSTARLRAVYSGRDLAGSAARAAILGTCGGAGDASMPTSPSGAGDGSFPRRGSLTPLYDPFAAGKTSVVSASTPADGVTPNMGRRGSVTVVGANGAPVQMRSVRLHVEYLTAQSSLIRQVLAQATGYQAIPDAPLPPTTSQKSLPTPNSTPPPQIKSSIPPPPSHVPSNPFPHSFFRFSPHRYPRVIPSPPVSPPPTSPTSPTHIGPTIILPVPDPSSFPVLIHYMYHGRTEFLEDALRSGSVTWEGLVRNVEYLGLREDVKKYLGKWWKSWRESDGRPTTRGDEEEEEEYHYPTTREMRMDMEDDVSSPHAWSSTTVTGSGGPPPTSSLDDEMAGLLGKF